jgi:hypothetical protein
MEGRALLCLDAKKISSFMHQMGKVQNVLEWLYDISNFMDVANQAPELTQILDKKFAKISF